jgi:L-ribulose-5-phosphate 4-epimerase
MLEELKKRVLDANLLLKKYGLIKLTWGNVSEIDRSVNLVAIKPSGVPYEEMTVDSIVITDLDGKIVEGEYRPSSDLATHLEIYKKYPSVNGVTHTHSPFATIFAQAQVSIPILGTTHADYFYGDIPLTRKLTKEEIASDYEKNTGKVILETIGDKDPLAIPAIIVASHGPFTYGTSGAKSVENALVLEECAFMAYHSLVLAKHKKPLFQQDLADVHYNRKHGKNAYYGQVKK